MHVNGKEDEAYVTAVNAAFASQEVAVLDACKAALECLKPSSASPELASGLLFVARSNVSPIAANAIAALQLAGVDVDAESDAVLTSSDEDDRVSVLVAHAARPSMKSRDFLRRALRADAHFACRLHAARALAEGTTDDDRLAVLALKSDPSGPVRAECARLVGEKKWEEGRDALIAMLRDQQNASPDTMTIYATPEYRVARVAAEALGEFDELRGEDVRALSAFLRDGKLASDDVEVHRSVLAMLRVSDDPKVTPLIVEQLSSTWRMEGTEGAAYPMRYAAAYAIAARIFRDAPTTNDSATIAALVCAAEHSDDRLAAPALTALGFAGEQAANLAAPLLRHEETTPERALLYAAAYAARTRQMPQDAVLGDAVLHPGWRTLSFALGHASTTDEEWAAHLEAHADEREWVKRIESSSQIHAALRRLLALKLLQSVTVIASTDFREGELATVVPMLTLHQRW
jgi:hypothetical protein